MKSILLLITCLTISYTGICQKNKSKSNECKVVKGNAGSNSYVYEYESINELSPEKDCYEKVLHKKSKIKVIVKNVNRLVYDVKEQSQNISIALPNTSLFDSLAGSFKNSISDSPGNIDGSTDSIKQTRTIKNKKGFSLVTVTIPDPYSKEKKEIKQLQEEISKIFPGWVRDMQMLEHFVDFGKNAPNIIATECCSQVTVKQNLVSDPAIQSFSQQPTTYTQLKSIVNNEPVRIAKRVKQAEELINEKKKKVNELLSYIRKECKKNKTQDADYCDLDTFEDNYPPDLDKAMSQSKEISIQKIIESVASLNNLLSLVENPGNFSYQSQLFYPDGDYIDIGVTFKPKPVYANLHRTDSSLNYHIPIKGRFEWAIGPSINFHVTSSMFDESYKIDSAYQDGKAKKDTFSITKNKSRDKIIPNIGIMAHFYWQNHNKLTPGFCVGLSTSTDNLSQLRFYLGGSLLIGGDNGRVMLNAGLGMGAVNVLKSNLTEGENPKSQIPFTGTNLPGADQLVEKKFRAGIFFGATYKLNN